MAPNTTDDDTIDSSSEDEEVENALDKKQSRVKTSAVHCEFTREEIVPKRRKKDGAVPSRVSGSKCKHCPACYVGRNPTTLTKHLKSAHYGIYKDVIQKDESSRAAKKDKLFAEESKSTRGRKTAASVLFAPSPLDKFLNRNSSLPMPVSKQRDTERRMAYWVGSSTLPLNLVEQDAFETFIQGYDSQVLVN